MSFGLTVGPLGRQSAPSDKWVPRDRKSHFGPTVALPGRKGAHSDEEKALSVSIGKAVVSTRIGHFRPAEDQHGPGLGCPN